MVKDLTFQALKLLSQSIVSNPKDIPEGALFQKTSCMNPEDGEMIGTLMAISDLIKEETPDIAEYLNKYVIDFLEKIGISHWAKTELTHLGFRVGLRHHQTVDVAKDSELPVVIEVDEASIEEE